MSYTYNAFISYSRSADEELAPALQSALHSVGKPWYRRRRTINVCLDKSSFSIGPSLQQKIEEKLSNSEFLILLASPQAAESPWVEQEINWWLQHRSIKTILIGVTGGEIVWNKGDNDFDLEQSTALPPCLKSKFKEEPLYADFRPAKKEEKLSLRKMLLNNLFSVFHNSTSVSNDPVLSIAAELLKMPKDEIDSIDIRQYKKNLRWAQSAIGIILIATVAAGGGIYKAYQENKEKTSRKLANLSQTVVKQRANLLPQGTLLAVQGMKTFQTLAADQSLYQSLHLLGPKPIKKRSYQGLLDLIFSPHGKYLVQLPYDGPAVVEETVNGKPIANLINLSSHNDPVDAIRQISFSNDEKRIATQSSLGLSTFVWELPSGRELFRTPVNRGAIVTSVLSGNGKYLATGHTNGNIYLWDITCGKEVLSFNHSAPPHMMQFSHNGKYLAISSSLKEYKGPSSISMVRLWNVEKNVEVAQLQLTSAVMDMTFSPDNKYLAATNRVGEEQDEKDRFGRVKIWKTDNGKEVAELRHDDRVEKITFSANSKYVLTGCSDGKVRIWDINSGKEQLVIDHGSNVKIVDSFNIEGFPYLVSAGDDGVLRLWEIHIPVLEYQRLLTSIKSPNVLSFVHNADEQYLAILSHNLKADVSAAEPKQYQRDLRVWKVEDVKHNLPLDHEKPVGIAHFSPNGRHLATVDFQMPTSQLIPKSATSNASMKYMDLGEGNAYIWDVASHKRRPT